MSGTLADPGDGPPGTPDPGPAANPAVVAAFTEFYRVAAPKLVAFLSWQGATWPDAADCAQDALTQAFHQWPTLRDHYAWCRRVASRLYARRLATIREDPTADVELVGAPLLTDRTAFDAVERRHHILALLELLPLRQRQVMAWTYDGATPAEIAEQLQITPETVRSSLHKARVTLRRHEGDIR